MARHVKTVHQHNILEKTLNQQTQDSWKEKRKDNFKLTARSLNCTHSICPW